MNQSPLDPGVRQLVAAVVDGQATAEQREELQHRLLASAAARDFYLDYVNLHSALRRQFLLANEDHTQLTSEFADFRRAAVAEMYPARRRRSAQRTVAVLAGLAIALAIAIGWFSYVFNASDDASVVATLRAVTGHATLVDADGARTAQIGDVLRPGQTLRVGREAAQVAIAYPDGTLVHIHATSVVESPRQQQVRLRLLSGSMEVAAAKQPPNRPLIFATEHSRYVVLGTRFRLYCEAAESRLELDEGKVRLERPASGESVEVVAGSVAISADERSPVVIQRMAAGQAVLLEHLRHAGQKVEFSPDGTELYSSNGHDGLYRWQPETAAQLGAYRRDPGAADALAVCDDGQTLVQANRNGYVLAWRGDQKHATKLKLGGQHTRSRALSADGAVVAESSNDGTVVLAIDLAHGKLRKLYHFAGPGKAWCLSLSRGGEFLAAGFWDGTTRVVEIASGETIFERKLQHTPTLVDLSADGQRLVVFTQRDGLKLIDIATGEEQSLWQPAQGIVKCARFTPDGQRIIAGLNDRTARMWSVADGRQLLVIDAGHSPQGVAWSEELQMLATADGSVKLWKCSFESPAVAVELSRILQGENP